MRKIKLPLDRSRPRELWAAGFVAFGLLLVALVRTHHEAPTLPLVDPGSSAVDEPLGAQQVVMSKPTQKRIETIVQPPPRVIPSGGTRLERSDEERKKYPPMSGMGMPPAGILDDYRRPPLPEPNPSGASGIGPPPVGMMEGVRTAAGSIDADAGERSQP